MFTSKRTPIVALSTASLMGAGLLLAAAPSASAASTLDVEKKKDGRCSASNWYEFELEKEHGRIEVDFEVESNKVGQAWKVRLKHDGVLIVKKKYVTERDGDFSVERNLKDKAGKDTIKVRATNAKTGEVCVAKMSI